jgi:hypothetical protein
MYTGACFILYNARLRGFPAWAVELLRGNDYETTIFVIASGITKLAKVTDLPAGGLVYRGCGGMILPRSFWEDFAECQATLVISPAVSADPASKDLVQQLKRLCAAPVPPAAAAVPPGDPSAAAAAAAASAFDLGSTYLKLNLGGDAAKKLLAGNPGVRVVKGPAAAGEGGGARVVVALPLSEFDLTDSLKADLVAAVVAALGGGVLVRVEEVANKPRDFKGGGDVPPPSTIVNHTMVCFPNKPPNHTMVCFLTGGHQLWQLFNHYRLKGETVFWGNPKTAPPQKRRSSLFLTSARSAPKFLRITF